MGLLKANKMMNKLLPTLALILMPVIASALDHTSNGEYITITGGGAGKSYVSIPGTIDGLPVKVIAKEAFVNCGDMKQLKLPDGLKIIKHGAFAGCTNLKSLKIPEGVESIGAFAFNNCADLQQVSLPDSLVSIGNSAFASCKIKSISIPKNVEDIGNCPFSNCEKLKSIHVTKENKAFVSHDGMLIGKERRVLIQCPEAKSGEIIIPNGVEVIGSWAFSGCERVTYIEMPESLKTIEKLACQFSGLREVNLPPNLKTIGKMAFLNCEDLKEVTFPAGLELIGEDAFRACSKLIPLDIPSSVKVKGK